MSLVRLFTDFHGRIGLRTFWLGSIAVALTLLATERTVLLLADHRHEAMIIPVIKALALFPWAALAAKRATDRGSTPLFGILLICAIVLPAELQPHLGYAWRPSLDAISTIAWLIALVDLGLLPGARPDRQLAARRAAAKPAS